MSFYQLLFSRKLNGINRNLTWYWNLFAKYMRENVGTLLAKILKIKGNTIVWNQLLYDGNFTSSSNWSAGSNATITVANNQIDAVPIDASVQGNRFFRSYGRPYVFESTHTYLFFADAKGDSYFTFQVIRSSPWGILATKQLSVSSSFRKVYGTFSPSTSDSNCFLSFTFDTRASLSVKNANIIDLTMLNDPNITDYDSFVQYYPLPYYSYSTGSLLSFNGTGIKSVGFNQWDEEWEVGRFDTTTGANVTTSGQIRAKNLIPVLPNTQYNFNAPNGETVWLIFFDANEVPIAEHISVTTSGNSSAIFATNGVKTFTTPSGARYMRFYMLSSYGATYKNDICINISSSENGTYKPYKSNTLSLPISTYFPTGMKSAGSVYDELTPTKAITRVGYVDLGSLNYTYVSANVRFEAEMPSDYAVPTSASDRERMTCAKYETNMNPLVANGKNGITGYQNSNKVFITDSAYTDATIFKNSLSGTYLYYELATPTEVSIEPPLNLSYEIEWGGTEQLLPENTSTPTTSPILADIQYPDGERDDQYFTYREIRQNTRTLNMALSTLLGRDVSISNPQEPLDILMKGE